MKTLPQVTGVILAGGQGSRMGGIDKGLAAYRGRPLVAHVLERLRPQVTEILISANRNESTYAELGCRVIADRIGGFAGPLAGLHAALESAALEWVVTVPCDCPGLPTDLVARLWRALEAAQADMAIATAAGRMHPVFCLCSRSLRDSLAGYLARGERQVRRWQNSHRTAEVPFDDQPEAFANFNTPDDLLESP